MKDKLLPWFLLFCAIGLSGTAAYYSVLGLSVVFIGVAIPVIIMGSFLELSKIAIATYLHDKWKETYGGLKIYMTIALITLSIITSLGIYGLLSTGFSSNIAKLEINNKKIKNIEVKKERFEEIKKEHQTEKSVLDKDITNLRNALSTNTTTQSIDRTSGQVITRANTGNRRAFEDQLKVAQQNRDILSKKIESLNDSITKLDIDVLNLESEEISGNELGTIKYMSELLDWDVKRTANLFILILIFVFDPLAITLVIATNQAFKGKRKEEDTPQVTPQVEPVIIEKIVEVPVEKIVEVPVEKIVEKIVEVPVKKETLPVEDYFENEYYDILEKKEDIIVETPEEQPLESKPEVLQNNEPIELRKLTYTNRNNNSGSIRINRF